MPAALRLIADRNPGSALAVAVLGWSALLLLAFVPLASWRYRRS